ncbi:MAG: NAD(P)-dependent oxidoreductase [Actinobacteria bacterium]|nr:NAD(P)-dependent oxidoreductase [Actinomycetota bacterium]
MHGTAIGVLHPGEMGAAVGASLAGQGHPVLWASEDRGPASAARAAGAGLMDTGTADSLARQADMILSICPPHAALAVARSVAGFRGVYVDANAVSPATAREVGRAVTAGGASFVDGGIIGQPPVPGEGSAGASSRLYLSGPEAARVAALFAGTPLAAVVIGGEPGRASAVKMAYAAWTKGTAALILAARALASAEGVGDELLREWEQSQPTLPARCESAARSAAHKGWRWAGEMEEIAASMAAAGLPAGFHRAAAEVFRRSPAEPEATGQQPAAAATGERALGTVIRALLARQAAE